MKPRIYDKNMNLVGVLQNATQVGYTHKFNDLYTAHFKLPINDPKNSLCETYNIVDIFDGDESKGKYRILEEPDADVTSESTFIEYSLEHVITFLINDVIDGYLELGGYHFRTKAILEELLNRQTVKRWKLGECDFDRQFQYSWENTSIMDALFSVPTCFDEDYHWEYDTSSYPWTISLKRRAAKDRSCEIRRKRNMKFIKRHIDGSKLCTRLYCKGYGEGVNQLTVADANHGLPYIQDDEAVKKYGVLSSHWIDRRFRYADTLYARGLAILNELKVPAVSYTASAVDLSRVTGYDWDKFDEGKYVHMIDDERGIDVDAMIIETSKDDVDGNPLDMSITICNKSSDVSTDLEDIARRASITSQYAQGATNLYCEQFADNADTTHPAKMRIYIPDSCANINQVLLSWRCSPFRAYSTGATAGGGTTATSGGGGGTNTTSGGGGASTVTSDGGGATTVTSDGGGGTKTTSGGGGATTATSSSGGGTTVTSDGGGGATVTSKAGGSTTATSEAGGSTKVTKQQFVITHDGTTSGPKDRGQGNNMSNTGVPIHTSGIKASTDSGGDGETGDSSMINTKGSGTSLSTTAAGGHTHTSESHDHGMGHFHYAPGHTHGINSHTHTFSGSDTVPNGHYHKISKPGTSTTTDGVSANVSHSVSISGDTGGKSLTTNSAGNALTGNAVYSSGDSHIYTTKTAATISEVGNHQHYMADHLHNMQHTHTIPAHTHGMNHYHNFSHVHDVNVSITIPEQTIDIPSHQHKVSIDSHKHDVTIDAHTHGVTIGAHEHTVELKDHTHSVTLDSHTHSVSIGDHTHSVSIPEHTHSVTLSDHTHSVTLKDHTHNIVYGIYEGTSAQSCTVKVDGETALTEATSGNDIDIVPYLSKNDEGRITRGTWHEIEIVPDRLSRIEADLFVKTFITSYTGGNY